MKKILCIILCFVMVLSLAACGGNKDNSDATKPVEGTQETPKPTEPHSDYRENSVEDVAQKFIKSLITSDYETALRCFNVPSETPFFTSADIEWYLPRSNYADVEAVTYEKYTVTVDTDKKDAETATCIVTVKDTNSEKTQTFTLNMVLDTANKWGVKDNDFYLDEYYVVAPGGEAKLAVNGVDAANYKSDKFGTTQYQYIYKLTYVGKSEKTLAVSHANFETVEEKVFPVANTAEEPLKLIVEYSDEAALTAMKDIWMEFYQAVLDKKTYSEMVHLLSPSANTELAKGVMDGLNGMIDKGSNHDFAITKMTYAAQKDGQHTKWLASDKLQIAFNYSLSWIGTGIVGNATTEDMNHWDIVVLHYDGEKFTLDTNINNNMFTELDAWNDESI